MTNHASMRILEQTKPGNKVKVTLVFDRPTGTKPVSIQLHDSMFSDGVTVSLS